MNVIEALFITLGLDTREYEKNSKQVMASLTKMGEASKKQTDLIAESGKKAAHSFSLLKIEVLGALAAFGLGDGFKAFIQDNINGQAALGRMSKTLGMSTHQLQAWKLASKEMGGSGNDIVSAMQTVASGIADAHLHGTSALVSASYKYGVGITGNDTASQAMLKLNRAAYARSQKYGPQQAIAMLREEGISDFTVQQMLLQDPAKFQAQLAHTMALTGAATKASTEQAAKLQAQWADLQERFRQVGERVFVKLEPVLEKLGKQLANWLDHIDWNKVIAAIGRFIDKVQDVVKEMGGWKRVAEILGAVLALKVLSPIIGLVFNMAKLVPLLGGATAGVEALTAAMRLLGPAVAAVGGYYVGSKLSDMLDAASQKATDNKDETWGAYLWDRYHKYNPKTGEMEFDLWGGMWATDADVRANIAQENQAIMGPGNVHNPNVRMSRALTRAEQTLAMQYLMRSGFTQAQAAGIVGNLTQESSMRAGAIGPDGKHFGIAQWGGSRITDFNNYAKSQGWGVDLQHSTLPEQLQFLVYELHHSKKKAYQALLKTVDPSMAALVFDELFEVPGSQDHSLSARLSYARQINSAYPGARAAQAGKAANHTNTVSINTLNVNAPKATDAKGVAAGMKTALQMNPLIAGYVTSLA